MSSRGSKMRLGAIILICFVLLLSSGVEQPAFGSSNFAQIQLIPKGREAWIAIAARSLGLAALTVAAYYMYKNSPAQRTKGYPKDLGPGEWYIGGYLGFSYLPPNDWKFTQNDTSNLLGPAARIHYSLGPEIGLKFGRFLDRAPWFGIEVETRFSKNNIPNHQGTITPTQPNQPSPLIRQPDWFMIWAIQVNLIARYGLLKDKEVPFGRLQPYIGIGPGFDIDYGKWDSTKNFAIETMAGIRYMLTQHLGVFFEYKFTYQFALEYQDVTVYNTLPNYPRNALPESYTFTFDQPHHMFVVGLSYHFKSLYGN